MDAVLAICKWCIANWADLMSGLLMVVGGASIIVKLTPTPKDDEILGKIKKIINRIALNPVENKINYVPPKK